MTSNVKQQLIITKNELSDLMAMMYVMSLNEKSNLFPVAAGNPRSDEAIKKMFLNMNFVKTLDTHFDALFINSTDTEYVRSYNEA